MRTAHRARLALGAPLITAGLLAITAMRSPAPAAPNCTFKVDQSIPIGPEPTAVPIALTQSVGDSLSAEFPPESNVDVVKVTREKSDGPLTATLTLSTDHATAGRWDATIRGERGSCSGKVPVGVSGARANADTTALISTAKTETKNEKAADCSVFMEDTITTGNSNLELVVKYSEPIGEAMSAAFPQQAGIDVISFKKTPHDDPLSAHITLNTSRAVPGQWKLTIMGDLMSCAGTVYVGKSKR